MKKTPPHNFTQEERSKGGAKYWAELTPEKRAEHEAKRTAGVIAYHKKVKELLEAQKAKQV